VVSDFLARSYNLEPIAIKDERGEIVGVFLTKAQFELLRATAEIARNRNLSDSLRSVPTETLSFADVFRKGEK
jgi:hypothetical protein